MSVTAVGDKMCWWQVWDNGDKLRHQYQELVAVNKYQSPTWSKEMMSEIGNQYNVANIEILTKLGYTLSQGESAV